MFNSILRYPGGKSRAAKFIADRFPYRTPKEIVSPFFGGGSVEFLLASRGATIYGYDNFFSLACFWNHVKTNCHELAFLIPKYYPLTKMEFIHMQNRLVNYDVGQVCNLDCAASFFVLNRASFSGTTLSGGMSPDHPRFNLGCIQRLKEFEKRMRNVSVEHKDFEESLALHKDKWTYCDPPYYLEKDKANLYGIRGNLHRFFDHQKLYNILKSRDNWLLSYNDCKFIRDLYYKFHIESVQWKYGMGKEKDSKEILIRPFI